MFSSDFAGVRSLEALRGVFFIKKGAQAGGRTWDLLVFVYFLSLRQRLTPLGHCAPLKTGDTSFPKIIIATSPLACKGYP